VVFVKRKGPRRHHYVPQFYQKGFAGADESLLLYDRNTQRYLNTHPRNICCENELYTMDPEGEADRKIESTLLSQIDGDGATAIRELEAGRGLSRAWVESFSIYMALQITRTPAFRLSTAKNYRAMGEEFLRIGFSDVDRARQMMKTYAGEASEAVTAESLVDSVIGGQLRVDVTERPFLQQMHASAA
jgi:hypothetical protein